MPHSHLFPHGIRNLQRPMFERSRGRDDVVDHALHRRRDKRMDLTLDDASDPSLHECTSEQFLFNYHHQTKNERTVRFSRVS